MKNVVLAISLLLSFSLCAPCFAAWDDHPAGKSPREEMAETNRRLNCEGGYTTYGCGVKKEDKYRNVEPPKSDDLKNSFRRGGGAPSGSIGKDVLRGFEPR